MIVRVATARKSHYVETERPLGGMGGRLTLCGQIEIVEPFVLVENVTCFYCEHAYDLGAHLLAATKTIPPSPPSE